MPNHQPYNYGYGQHNKNYYPYDGGSNYPPRGAGYQSGSYRGNGNSRGRGGWYGSAKPHSQYFHGVKNQVNFKSKNNFDQSKKDNRSKQEFKSNKKHLSHSLSSNDKHKSLESEPTTVSIDSSNENEKERLKKVEEDKARLSKLLSSSDGLPSVDIDNSQSMPSVSDENDEISKKRESCLTLPTLEMTVNDYKKIGAVPKTSNSQEEEEEEFDEEEENKLLESDLEDSKDADDVDDCVEIIEKPSEVIDLDESNANDSENTDIEKQSDYLCTKENESSVPATNPGNAEELIAIDNVVDDCHSPEKSDDCLVPEELGDCVPEKSNDCFVPEKSDDCFVPEKSDDFVSEKSGDYVPEKSGDYVPEKSDDCFVPEKSDDCYVPEKSDNCYVPEKSDDCYVPEKLDDCYVPDKSIADSSVENHVPETLPSEYSSKDLDVTEKMDVELSSEDPCIQEKGCAELQSGNPQVPEELSVESALERLHDEKLPLDASEDVELPNRMSVDSPDNHDLLTESTPDSPEVDQSHKKLVSETSVLDQLKENDVGEVHSEIPKLLNEKQEMSPELPETKEILSITLAVTTHECENVVDIKSPGEGDENISDEKDVSNVFNSPKSDKNENHEANETSNDTSLNTRTFNIIQEKEEIVGFVDRNKVYDPQSAILSRKGQCISTSKIGNLYRSFLKCRRYGRSPNLKEKIIGQMKSNLQDNPFLNKENLNSVSRIDNKETDDVVSENTVCKRSSVGKAVEDHKNDATETSDTAELEADEFMENYGHLLDHNFTIPEEVLQKLGLSSIAEEFSLNNIITENNKTSPDSFETDQSQNVLSETHSVSIKKEISNDKKPEDVTSSEGNVGRLVNEVEMMQHNFSNSYDNLNSAENVKCKESNLTDKILQVNESTSLCQDSFSLDANLFKGLSSENVPVSSLNVVGYSSKFSDNKKHFNEVYSQMKSVTDPKEKKSILMGLLYEAMSRLHYNKKAPAHVKRKEAAQLKYLLRNIKTSDFFSCVVESALKFQNREKEIDPAGYVLKAISDSILKLGNVPKKMKARFMSVSDKLINVIRSSKRYEAEKNQDHLQLVQSPKSQQQDHPHQPFISRKNKNEAWRATKKIERQNNLENIQNLIPNSENNNTSIQQISSSSSSNVVVKEETENHFLTRNAIKMSEETQILSDSFGTNCDLSSLNKKQVESSCSKVIDSNLLNPDAVNLRIINESIIAEVVTSSKDQFKNVPSRNMNNFIDLLITIDKNIDSLTKLKLKMYDCIKNSFDCNDVKEQEKLFNTFSQNLKSEVKSFDIVDVKHVNDNCDGSKYDNGNDNRKTRGKGKEKCKKTNVIKRSSSTICNESESEDESSKISSEDPDSSSRGNLRGKKLITRPKVETSVESSEQSDNRSLRLRRSPADTGNLQSVKRPSEKPAGRTFQGDTRSIPLKRFPADTRGLKKLQQPSVKPTIGPSFQSNSRSIRLRKCETDAITLQNVQPPSEMLVDPSGQRSDARITRLRKSLTNAETEHVQQSLEKPVEVSVQKETHLLNSPTEKVESQSSGCKRTIRTSGSEDTLGENKRRRFVRLSDGTSNVLGNQQNDQADDVSEVQNNSIKSVSLLTTNIKGCFVNLACDKLPKDLLSRSLDSIKVDTINTDENPKEASNSDSDCNNKDVTTSQSRSTRSRKKQSSTSEPEGSNVQELKDPLVPEPDISTVWGSFTRVNAIKEHEGDLFVGCDDGRTLRMKSEGDLLDHVYSGHDGPVNSIEFFNDYLVTGSSDSVIIVHNLSGHKNVIAAVPVMEPVQTLCVRWQIVFIGSKKGKIMKFSCYRKSMMESQVVVGGEHDTVLDIIATKEGPRRTLIVATKNQPLTIRDAMTGLLLRSVNFNDIYYSLGFYGSTPFVFCGTRNNSVAVINFTTGEKFESLKLGKNVIKIIIKWDVLFTASYDGFVHIYNLKEKILIAKFPVTGLIVEMELWNNKIILSTSNEGPVVINFPSGLKDYLKQKSKEILLK